MIIFAAAQAVTERRNPNASSWEVTPSLEGSAPSGPRMWACAQPRLFRSAAEAAVLGSRAELGSWGKLAVSQPGCRAPSAPTQKGRVSQVPQANRRMLQKPCQV